MKSILNDWIGDISGTLLQVCGAAFVCSGIVAAPDARQVALRGSHDVQGLSQRSFNARSTCGT